MPALGGSSAMVAVTSSSCPPSSRGGATRTRNAHPAPLRTSPLSMSNTMASAVGGGGGQKTKNSTNCERRSISKMMDRMAQSLESCGGGGGEESFMLFMLSNQMQQTAQDFSMQQTMFQHRCRCSLLR
jgi:hypothetical protein